MTRFKQHALRAARLARGVAVRQAARDCGIDIQVLNRLESADSPSLATLSVSNLINLADYLAVPISTLLHDTAAATDEHSPESVPVSPADAQILGALLHSLNNIQVPVAVLCDSLDWDIDRLNQAAEHLDATLRPGGLMLYRRSGRVSINAISLDHEAALLRARRHPRINRENRLLTPARARILYQAERSPISPHSLSRSQRVNVATLVSAGLLIENQNRYFVPDSAITASLHPGTETDGSRSAMDSAPPADRAP